MNSRTFAKAIDYLSLSTKLLIALSMWLMLGVSALAAAPVPLTIVVKGVMPDGTEVTAPTDYRWTVEQDATKYSMPGKAATAANYSFSLHTSYMPVVAAGRFGTAEARAHAACNVTAASAPANCDPDVFRLYRQPLPNLDPGVTNPVVLADKPELAKRYFVTIAATGFQIGSAPVVFNSTYTAASATVYLNKYPLPAAQISVFAFNDNNPLNGAPDLPAEAGLAGFHVHLFEAGGTYGMSGGEVTQDAFGNPLGTTYLNEDGDVDQVGTGIVLTDANGVANFKNLFPGKYTILIVPPEGSDWHQTSTIEGTRGSDAWVKNNEPSFFQEFGPPGHHVFIGFTRSGHLAGNDANGVACTLGSNPGCTPVLGGAGHTVSGRVINTHNSRPPVFTFYRQAPVNECWVALQVPLGRALYARPCNKDSTFSFENVPDGDYEIVVWDDPLDMIIGTTTITVDAADLALGDLPVTSWFGRYQGRVFQDIDGTGLPFFAEAFERPYIEVDPVTGIEREVQKSYAKGELKPPFGEGIANNIRFRDGSIYQSVNTKKDGTFAFNELFPFFNFMIGEIDYARFKATGATVVVDEGGCVKVNGSDCATDPAKVNDPRTNTEKLWAAQPGLFGGNDPELSYNPWIRLNPQLQTTCSAADVATNTDTNGKIIDYTACFQEGAKYYRTEQGVTLLEGMQTFLGQTNHIEWGKQPYGPDENGGIAGIVHYAITRAEDDPRLAAAEPWEPGVPRVQVNMLLDCDGDGRPDKPLNDGTGQCAAGGLSSADGYAYDAPDVDNYPYCWRDAAGNPDSCPNGTEMGAEDIKRSRTGGLAFSYGDVFRWGTPGGTVGQQTAIGLSATDSWDDNIPTGCPDLTPYTVPFSNPPKQLDCFDGLRNFNQVVPAVFDGGYAFGRVAGQAELPMVIGAKAKGSYIVEAVAPPGYLHQGNGDKNVTFGDALKASTAALPFECVGQELDVPQYLTLFPDQANPNYSPGAKWRKCDMKSVALLPGTNPAPDFFLFTEAPVAGHGVGFILDDTTAEFNYLSPNFGEKHSPPHLPISVQDWTGREISRVYSDQYGSYNFLVPSTFTIFPPFPSGVTPSMMVACMNHPGPIKVGVNPDGSDKMGLDPHFNRGYSQFCYTLQYLPGKTTYLDTPVLPVAAFAAVDKYPLDCECADGTPVIYSVTNGDNGPWVPGPGGVLTIISVGATQIINPAFDPNVPGSPRLITRDYGFGSAMGVVMLGNTPLTITSWSNGLIKAVVPTGASTGQLSITRGGSNGKSSMVGITVHVGGSAPIRVNLAGTNGAFKSIQAAIDSVPVGGIYTGRLITVAPGTYKEYVIMDKRVTLQGWGAGSTVLDSAKSATVTLANWRARLASKLDPQPDGTINVDTGQPNLVPGPSRTFDVLPGQTLGTNLSNNEPLLFGAEEGPSILVVGRQGLAFGGPLTSDCLYGNTAKIKIDGLTVTGGDSGGGILASGYACGLEVSNNRVVANYGTYGGGIRVGHTLLSTTAVVNGVTTVTFTDAVNRNTNLHHNWVSQNGATAAGGGGGVTLGKGADGYSVTDNYICGNFSMADGGGLSHLGLSAGSMTTSGNNAGAVNSANLIARNKFVFNQTFNQSADPMGGGASIASQLTAAGAPFEGTGDVVLDSNLFQGNQAGAGAGGGLSIARTTDSDDILLTNNIMVNNVAAYAGGGVAMSSIGAGVRLINNTIASNVSTASNRQSWPGGFDGGPSTPQIAGISVLSGSNPELLNNILWANRSFIYLIQGTTSGLFNPGSTNVAQPGASPVFNDLGRIDNVLLAPRYSVLTSNGEGNAAYLTGTGGCGNTAPTGANLAARQAIRCNLGESANSTSLFIKSSNFESKVDPTAPVNFRDATVMLQSALTVDETGNFVNVIFTPLTLWEISGPNIGAARADYHLGTNAVAQNIGRARGTDATALEISANFVPTADFDGDLRPTAVDIGADERPSPPPPVLASVSPNSGVQSSTSTLQFSGSYLSGTTAVTSRITGGGTGGISCTVNSSTAISVTANCTISAAATTGVHFLSVTTPNGSSNELQFTVLPPPNLLLMTPTSGARGTTVAMNFVGTNLSGVTTVNAGAGINCTSVSSTAFTASASCAINVAAATGTRSVTVTSPAGTSNGVNFAVTIPPTLTTIAPNSTTRGTSLFTYSNVNVTIQGTGLSAASLSWGQQGGALCGALCGGLLIDNVTVTNATTITARVRTNLLTQRGNFSITATTSNGTSNIVTFRVN